MATCIQNFYQKILVAGLDAGVAIDYNALSRNRFSIINSWRRSAEALEAFDIKGAEGMAHGMMILFRSYHPDSGRETE
jgi:hypothetical protein